MQLGAGTLGRKGGCSRGPAAEAAVTPLEAPLAVRQNPRGAVREPGLRAPFKHLESEEPGEDPCIRVLFRSNPPPPLGVVLGRELWEPAAPVPGAGGLLSWELPVTPGASVPPSLGDTGSKYRYLVTSRWPSRSFHHGIWIRLVLLGGEFV